MASLVAIMIHQQKMNDVWLSQKVKPALPHFQFQKRAPVAVRDRMELRARLGGLPFQDLGTGKCVALFLAF